MTTFQGAEINVLGFDSNEMRFSPSREEVLREYVREQACVESSDRYIR